jgi:hypothetical protein
MVKHIVLFKLTAFHNPEEKERQLSEMKKVFSVLPEQLPFIIEFRTAKNIAKAGHAWDFVIDSLFDSESDLKVYQESPEHLEAIRKAAWIQKEKAVVDYIL